MPEELYTITKCCCEIKNKNNILHLFKSISYCLICSAFIFDNFSSFKSSIKVKKPDIFENISEIPKNLLWLEKNGRGEFILNNKKDYLKLRSSLIKNMKKICSYFSLSLKTYFTSIEYLDRICYKLYSFDKNALFQISLFCIILATKFLENKETAIKVQTYLKENSKNFTFDEIYTLQLLDYNLNVYTSYDMIMDILYLGFVFENEDLNKKKLNALYNNIPKILYLFSESNSYINMESKQIAICMIGFFRELFGLDPFSENIQKIFMINNRNEKMYISGLNIIKKRIKIEKEIKNKTNE